MILRRIGINSAFKIGAIMGLITAIISGLLVVSMQALFMSLFTGLMSLSVDSGSFSSGLSGTDIEMMNAFGLAGLCIFYVVYIVFSTIAGGIGGVILALAYNLSARWVGGLELEVETEEFDKRKRSASMDDIYE